MIVVLSSRDRGTLAIDSSILPRRAENVKRKTGKIQYLETRHLEVPINVNTRQNSCFCTSLPSSPMTVVTSKLASRPAGPRQRSFLIPDTGLTPDRPDPRSS